MRKLIERSAATFRSRFIGDVINVLWESRSAQGQAGWSLTGLTDNYLRVNAHSDQDLRNRLSRVRILKETGDILLGQIIDPVLQPKCVHSPASARCAPHTHN